jgi:hypothetical protein
MYCSFFSASKSATGFMRKAKSSIRSGDCNERRIGELRHEHTERSNQEAA